MPTRQQIIEEMSAAVLKDRQESYGKPEDSFKIIAILWNEYLMAIGYAKNSQILHNQDVAVLMCLLKIARIAKSPGHADNWTDLAGYAVCGGEVATNNLQPCKETTTLKS